MRQRKIGELICDFNLYPRTRVDMVHVGYLKEAAAASPESIPPIVVDAKSLRIIDGVHRREVYLAMFGPDHSVDVIEKRYKNEGEMLADAIRMNAHHGRMLHHCDRVHCVLLAERVHLSLDATAQAMSMTVETLTELRADRVASGLTPANKVESIALKATIRHMAGKQLTHEQSVVNDKLSGMNQMFYVNQLVALIESDLLDRGNEPLLERLLYLGTLIKRVRAVA